MKSKIKILQKRINYLQKELELAIENGEGYDKIYKKSVYLDKIINEYFSLKTNLENKKANLISKYAHLIETSFKNKVISKMIFEIRKKYPTIGINELLIFSTNMYIYATLIVYKVPEQEIVNQLIFLNNNNFFNATQNENDIIIINRNITQSMLAYLTYIKRKYKKIVKEKSR